VGRAAKSVPEVVHTAGGYDLHNHAPKALEVFPKAPSMPVAQLETSATGELARLLAHRPRERSEQGDYGRECSVSSVLALARN